MNISPFISYLKIYLISFFVAIICISTLSGCFEHIQTFQRMPVTTPTSNTLVSSSLSVNSCRITQVSILGIPPENISISEADTSIYVQYPETFGVQSFKVTYKLNSAACSIWQQELDRTYAVCGGVWTSATVLFYDGIQNYPSRTYTVKYKPAGQFSIGQGQNPLTLTLGETTQVLVQVVNYFTRADYPKSPKIMLTRASDGRVLEGTLSCYTPPGISILSSAQMLLSVSASAYAGDEGTYQLQLQMSDGSKIICPQPVVIRLTDKVLITGTGDFQFYAPSSGQTHRFYGYNLSEIAKAGMDLIDGEGKRTSLPVVEYRDGNRQMIVRIPESMKGGHHIFQPTKNGVPLSQLGHFVIVDGNRPTFAYSFSPYTTYPLFPAPIQIGQTLYIRFQPVFAGSNYIKTKLKLVLKTDPTFVYLIDIQVVNEKPYSGFYPPKVIIPTDWIPGDYTASLVQTQPDGTTLEGPAHLQTMRLIP